MKATRLRRAVVKKRPEQLFPDVDVSSQPKNGRVAVILFEPGRLPLIEPVDPQRNQADFLDPSSPLKQRGTAVRYICPECGEPLIRTSTKHASCPNGHGKLSAWFRVADQRKFLDAQWRSTLPFAKRLTSAKQITKMVFEIEGRREHFTAIMRGCVKRGYEPIDRSIVLAKFRTVKDKIVVMAFRPVLD